MRYRPLGMSGIHASVVGMGTWVTGGGAVWGADPNDEESVRAIHAAMDLGVNLIDTAPAYGWGRSEEVVARAIRGRRDKVVIATKCGLWWKDERGSYFCDLNGRPIRRSLRPDTIQIEIEDSLRRLETDYIDLYQTHWPERDLPVEETLEALTRLVQAGKVRYAGCSNETAYGLTKSLWASDAGGFVRFETIQNHFNLLNRRFEDELAEACRREKVSLLPYSPLAGGVLSGKYLDGARPAGARFTLYENYSSRTQTMFRRFLNERTLEATRRFAAIAREAGLAPATLAVAWTLTHDFVGSTILGATHPDQLTDTLAAADVTLSADVIEACNAVSREIRYPMG